MAAHGGSVIEVKRENGKWQVVADSKYARRIDASTPMDITGPAAGHPRMQTSADPAGRRVLGMFNNCAGGVTPWGTWLTCEENIHHYFSGKVPDGHPEARNHRRYGVPSGFYLWGPFHDRFDRRQDPNEPNRFGWVVEIDPFDPDVGAEEAYRAWPRQARRRRRHRQQGRPLCDLLGRRRALRIYLPLRHHRRGSIRANPQANRDILDDGVASVARYNADGTLDWLPLVHGQGPLTAENGFTSQADVLIEKRRAADLLKRDQDGSAGGRRGEPVHAKVYAMLTLNERRSEKDKDAANPRAKNLFGHIIEMIPPDGDHAAAQFRWEILLRCGDPSIADVGATFSTATTRNGWFGMPDNLAFDSQGRMWIATDGNTRKRTGRTDGLWGVETEGPHARHLAAFLSRPPGRRIVRAVLHARRRDAVRRRPASSRGRIGRCGLHVRGTDHALARFQARTCRRGRRSS